MFTKTPHLWKLETYFSLGFKQIFFLNLAGQIRGVSWTPVHLNARKYGTLFTSSSPKHAKWHKILEAEQNILQKNK